MLSLARINKKNTEIKNKVITLDADLSRMKKGQGGDRSTQEKSIISDGGITWLIEEVYSLATRE